MNEDNQDTIEVCQALAERRGSGNAEADLCDDLIERFIDVMTSVHGFDRARCAEQREQLRSLQAWMKQHAAWGILNANAIELQRYIDAFPPQAPLGSQARAAAILRDFFAYLRELGVRRDNPASGVIPHRDLSHRMFEAVA